MYCVYYCCTEVKEVNSSSVPNKSDATAAHHQHNGNVKSQPLQESVDITGGISSVKLPEGDFERNINVDIETAAAEADIAFADDNVNAIVSVDVIKETAVDEYQHSLWKWPTGRSWLTKVRIFH